MGGNFWARKDGKFEVISSAPSVNLTPIGNSIVPVPYPVVSKSKLKISSKTVPYILLEGKEAFVKRSHTTNVKGDEKGSKGGVVSGTVSEKAEPITFDATVKGDGDFMIRDAEQFFMQNKNTVGKMTTTLSGSGSAVNAGGDITGPAAPADIAGQGSDAWSQALEALKDPMGAYAKLQDMKSKYDTVAGMINGDIPFSAAGLAGAVGGLTGNQTLMKAGSMLSQAETAKKMLTGEIPFSPAFAMGLAASATGNPSLASAAQTVGQAEGMYNRVDRAYGSDARTPTFVPSSSSPKATSAKPTPSALTKMIKTDTVNSFGKSLLGAMSSSEKPTMSMAMSGLGSLMGSPILLATAQSIQSYSLPPLLGLFPIDLNITYVSDLFYKGIFGENRRHSYEKQFYHLKEANYRLDLADGRWFRFMKQADGSFKDMGSLGVEITQIDEQTFELYYLKTATTEYYHKKYLRVIEDSNGNKIELTYQKTKNPKVELLESIANSSEASWSFTYNEQELVKSISDHVGRVWSFRYDKENYLTSIIFNKELEESYSYEFIERLNLPKQYLLSSVKNSDEQTKLSFTYNQKGEVSGYSQDEQHYHYKWHSLEQIEKTNSSGTSIFYGLDETKRVSAITYVDGSYEQEEWDNEKNIAHLKTRGGAKVVKSYDKQGRLLEIVKNDELIESFKYESSNPKPISHTKEGKTITYEYDKAYNLLAIILNEKTLHTYAYTKEGLVCSSKDALDNEILYEYNTQGLLSRQVDALNNPTNLKYDRLGRLRAVTLANGHTHHYSYNLKSQIIAYENPMGEKMEFSYTKSGKLKSLKDPAKRLTQFRYDKYDRVVAKVYPYLEEDKQQIEYYEYNPDNTIATITRVDGTTLYFNYDANQNVVKVLADNHQGEVESLSYTYDTLSNLVKAVHNNNRVLLEYDRELNLTLQTQNGLTVQSFYNEKHKQLESLTFLDHTQSYQYNKKNQLSKLINNQEEIFEFKYDKNAILKQRKYPNKTKEKFSYDEAYNLIAIEAKESHINYSYNEVGEIQTKWNQKDEDAKLYRYNARGELIQAGREDFSYNSAGNRLQEGWEYNYKNQLIQTDKYIYSYDARGNLQTKTDKETQEQTSYSFNLFNQLTKVVKTNTNQEVIEEFSYSYDALNRRVKKRHIKQQKETIHHYLYDNHNIVAILDKDKELLATIVHDTTTDTPLSITTHQNPLRELTEVEATYYDDLNREDKKFIDQKRRQRTYYYNRDHQGSICNLTNKDGKVVESFRYDDSYGRIVEHIKTEETLNPYCYTGREFENNELYYYRARYYDPTIGRFISSDPIEFMAGDFNFYRYVGNEPVFLRDPTGLYSKEEFEVDFYDGVINVCNAVVGVADSVTMGGVSAVSEKINSVIYGEKRAKSAREQTQNSTTYNVSKTVADYAPLPSNLGKTAIKKAVKEGVENFVEDKATEIIAEETGVNPSLINKKKKKVVKKADKKKAEGKANKSSSDSESGIPSANEAKSNDGTKAVKGGGAKSGSSSPDKKKTDKEKAEQEAKNPKDCPTNGKPVNPLTGIKVLSERADLVVDAPLPFIWQRSYASDNRPTMLLGQGWRLDIEFSLEERESHVVFADELGREILFKRMEVGGEQLFVKEKMLLSHPSQDEYRLKNSDGIVYYFRKSTNNELIYNIVKIEDQNANQLNFFRNSDTQLVEYIATDNHRLFEVEYKTTLTIGTRLTGLKELELDYQNEQHKLIETKEGRKLFLEYVQDENKIIHLNGVYRVDDEEERELKKRYELSSKKVKAKQLFSYEYSKEGDLVVVNNSHNEVTRTFEYRNHIMIAHKVPNGLESYYDYTEYTPKGKVLRNHTNYGESWSFEYLDGETKVTDNLGREKRYFFDNDDYPIALINALGEKKSIEYDDDGLPKKIINEAGDIKEYIYNGEGYPIVIKNNGSTTQISYDDTHKLPCEIIDDAGNTTKLEYDKQANLIKETLPDGSSTEYTRDARGFPIAIKDALGNSSSLQFDLSGNLTHYSDALGNTTYYSYDKDGKLLSLKDALEKTTHYSYNQKDLLSEISYADGTKESFEYNEKNQLIAHTNQEGTTTKYKLDQQGRVEQRVNALNHTLSYSYDQAGRVKALINENGSSYKFEYDALDRLTKEIGVDGLTTTYEYSPIGAVTKKTEAVGTADERVTHYKRDQQHQLITKEILGEKQEALVTSYEYDIIGQLTKAINPTAKVRLEYDPLGRITKEQTAILNLEEARVLTHEYDALGNRIKTVLPTNQTIEWHYNEIEQLTKVTLDNKEVTTHQRDALNQELSRTQGALETLNEYDSLGRLISQNVYNKEQLHNVNILNDEAKKVSRSYSYSKVGELLTIEDSLRGKTNYSYDRLGRVKETIKQNGSNETKELFAFDPAHNLLNDENDQALKNNQIETYQDKRYSYDTFGNLVNKKISNHTNIKLEYDAQNQLTKAVVTKHLNTNPITQEYSYTYDPFGRRVTKTDAFGTTYFTWDGNRLLTESRGESSQSYIYEQFGFTPLASIDKENNLHYYHNDHLGTPQEITNYQGEIVWEAEYSTWGNTAKVSYKQRDDNIQEDLAFQPLRFQGQYYDAETGLHYNRFRYYDPDIGRFISQDPIGLLGGTNLYQYAPNPVGWVDPLGLAPWETGKFNEWFNDKNTTPQMILDEKKSVSGALRNGGGKHEMFPVSMASKAKELGFTAEEIKGMSVDTTKIQFKGVTDKNGNPVPDGGHTRTRAGRHFHNKLINDLESATTKEEAKTIIKTHHDKHMTIDGKDCDLQL